MKPTLQSLLFLLACAAFGPPRVALAQTCNQPSTRSYRNDTGTTDVEKRTATETVLGTSFTAGSYLSGAAGATTNDIYTLSSTYAAQIDGRALIWRQNNSTLTFPNIAANNGSNNVNTPMRATVTLTFTREVSNLKFRVQDIDKGTLASPGGLGGGSDYTDEFGLYALRADGTTRVPLTAGDVVLGSNNTNAFVPGQTIDNLTHDVIRGTALNGTTTAPSLAGDVTITFAAPVKSVRLTFRNLNTYQGTTTRLQTLGIEEISWCAQADVTTTITAPTATIYAGQPTGNYTATFSNNGPDAANNVTRTVTLPAGATTTGAQLPTGATTTIANGITTINFGTAATVAANGSSSFLFSYTAPVIAATYTVQSNVGTDAGQTPNTLLDQATVNAVVNPAADVVTTLATAQTSVLAGANITYTATVTNNGPSAANGLVPQVQLPAGLTTAGFSNLSGGTYNNNTGIVTFPAITLNSGGTQTYPITFVAPNYTTTINGVASSTATTFDVNAANNNGTSNAGPTNAQVQTTVALPLNGCTGTAYSGTASSGLYAEYYRGYFADNLSFFANNTPGITRTDGTLNFQASNSWGNLLPTASNSVDDPDQYSARYRGSITIPTAGQYTFYLNSDDASYLWLDGAALAAVPTLASASINNGGVHGPVTKSVTLNLSAGSHNILIYYGEQAGGNIFTFTYNAGGASAAVQPIVPNSVLCATLSNVPPLAVGNTNVAIPNNAGRTTLSPSLAGTDQDGTVTNYAIVTLPTAAQGILRLADGTAVTQNQVITAAQAAGLTFQPTFGSAPGNVTFTFSAIDNTGQYSNAVATYTIPVIASADVTTTLAGPAVLNAGQPSGNFTATFTNNGPNQANGVTQQVTIPAGATNVLVNGVAFTPTNNVIDFATLSSSTLASGATNTFTYSFTVPNTTGTVMQNSTVTTTTSQGPNSLTDTANLTSTINAVADVATTITPSAASVANGQTASFTVTLANNGPSSAAGVVGTVQLPIGLVGVNITGFGAGAATYNSATGVVTYPTVTYASGTTNTSTISFTMPANGSATGTASISTTTSEAGQTANDVASATINGRSVFDVTTRISGPATTVAGTLTTYSVLTTNNGPSTAANISQTVQLPINLTNVFVSNGGTYDASNGVVTFPNLPSLANGIVVNNTISFMAPTPIAPAVDFPISAIVAASGDSNTNNNTAYLNGSATPTNVTVTPASTTNANLYTTITTPAANVQPGSAVTFTVVAGNNGPNAATSVVERIALPSGLTGVVITGNGATNANYNATTGLVTLPTVTSLASGSANTYTITVNAPATGMIAAVASISATTNDIVLADNIATTDVTVSTVTDVATTIVGPTNVKAGQPVTYVVNTTNNGIAPAANVAQTVNIPAGLSSVTLSGNGTYNPNTGIVTFLTIASQAGGNSVQNTIMYTAPAIGTASIIAVVTSTSPDNVRTNNRATVTTTTDAIADVTVSISGPTTMVQGNQIDYLVVTTNNGPSTAANVVTRAQLPVGLNSNGNPAVILSAGGTYNNTTGVVTFTTLATQRSGQEGTITNVIRFIAPANLNQVNASASVTTNTEESSTANNTASIITTETAPTTTQTDLSTVITSTPPTLTAGQPVKLTVTTTNGGPGAATGVAQRVALESGLIISEITNGGTYDAATGIVTFPIISLASGTATTNTITLVAPGTTPLQIRALVTGNESDANAANNSSFLNLDVTPVADVATSISGPTSVATGDAVTYSVLTLNNGPSLATMVAQTVTIPTGLPTVVGSTSSTTSLLLNGVGPTSIAGTVATYPSGTYDSSNGKVTFTTIASQGIGAKGQMMYTIAFTAPSTQFSLIGSVATTSTEPSTMAATNNNTSTVTVGPINTSPVANSVVNSLQTPQANTAGALLISPLSATDADGTVASYTITSVPNATAQGVLSLNGTALTVNKTLSTTEAANLRFDPVTGFVGNVFFTYTAKDNLDAASGLAATYTIPVVQDNASIYTATPAKTVAYQNNDVIAYVVDPNGAAYNSSGLIYQTTGVDAGKPVDAVNPVKNGVASTTTTGTFTSSTTAGVLSLTDLGLTYNTTTGAITVLDRTKLKAGTYTLNMTTTDLFGGVTTQPVTFTIGANPLPVVLTAFTAQAVQNRDALLTWTTASEVNSAYFDVERSLDGTNFTKIGQQAAKGNSAISSNYTFTDANVVARANGAVYYRLRQVDLDATASYSPVRTVSFTKVAAVALSLYPNPAQNATTLDVSALPATGTYQVLVLDVTGRAVRTVSVGGGQLQTLNLTDLASGTYQVLVTGTLANGDALRQVIRLTKE